MRARIIRAGLLALTLCTALLSPLAPRAVAQTYRRDGVQTRRGGYDQAQGVRGDARLIAQAEYYSGDTFNFETKTPRGVRVYAVNRPAPGALSAIDSGLAELFAVARRHGYSSHMSYTDYTVFIARPDRVRDSSGAYSPDIAIGAAQYAGSVYDQGGYVYAAGMVLSMDPCAFLIAEHQRDFQRISNVARYEGEHIVLYHNDRRLYAQTADHSRGGGHPILR